MSLSKKWKDHLKNNEMGYYKHLVFAVTHGLMCLEAGLLLIVHGFLPCFFEKAGTLLVRKLNKFFDQRRESRNCKKSRTEL